MALRRYVSIAVGAGVIATLSLLTGPAQVAELLRPVVARAPIADPPAVPCNKQEWYNADRACLTWVKPDTVLVSCGHSLRRRPGPTNGSAAAC